ncbi:MAG: beta-lactamase family protein [Clostridiales bacterium]|nr:beta-lactamase family protein [Clostridiales bacterium]
MSLLDRFRLAVAEQNLCVYGIRVETADGESVSHRWRSDDAENLYSGSKTFTSLAVGMCVDDGALRVTDRALGFFPEYRETASPGSGEITVLDLLHMASGKLEFWFGDPDQTALEARPEDWAELFFRVPVTREPGTQFFYSNACTYMLGRIVEKISGKTLRDFLLPRLFVPLGIPNPQWNACPGGHTLCATGLQLTTEEFSRLGLTLLNGGVYKGRRIVSEAWVQSLANDTIPCGLPGNEEPESAAGYGYQVWRCVCPGSYRADGMYGQFSIVVPDKRAVVTVTAHEEKAPYEIVRSVFRDIVPQL